MSLKWKAFTIFLLTVVVIAGGSFLVIHPIRPGNYDPATELDVIKLRIDPDSTLPKILNALKEAIRHGAEPQYIFVYEGPPLTVRKQLSAKAETLSSIHEILSDIDSTYHLKSYIYAERRVVILVGDDALGKDLPCPLNLPLDPETARKSLTHGDAISILEKDFGYYIETAIGSLKYPDFFQECEKENPIVWRGKDGPATGRDLLAAVIENYNCTRERTGKPVRNLHIGRPYRWPLFERDGVTYPAWDVKLWVAH